MMGIKSYSRLAKHIVVILLIFTIIASAFVCVDKNDVCLAENDAALCKKGALLGKIHNDANSNYFNHENWISDCDNFQT